MEDVVAGSLINTRIARIRAELGEGAALPGGGTLRTEVRAGLQASDNENQAVAEIFIELTGIPEKSKKADEFAFQVELIEHGVYEWPPGKRPANLKDIALNRPLCQPVYAVAMSEVSHLTQRMGFNGVRVPLDLPADGIRAAAPKKRRVRTTKQPAKPVAAKPVAAKPAKAK